MYYPNIIHKKTHKKIRFSKTLDRLKITLKCEPKKKKKTQTLKNENKRTKNAMFVRNDRKNNFFFL